MGLTNSATHRLKWPNLMFFTKKKDSPPSSLGGIVFYSSLFALLIFDLGFLIALPFLFSVEGFFPLSRFAIGIILGAWLSYFLFRPSAETLLHEMKHALVSTFLGNKWKGMTVEGESGEFAYQYYKETAAYNAFISLAPYWLPVFAALALGIGSIFLHQHHTWLCLVVGLAWGSDLYLAIKDIGPHQSDLQNIRGGYSIGWLYALVMNIAVASILTTWAMLNWKGFAQVGKFHIDWMLKIYEYFRPEAGVL